MRKSLLSTIPVVCLLTVTTASHASLNTDSIKVAHVTDGKINEWQVDKFEQDKTTQVFFSVSHDTGNLYLAMKIPDPKIQMKMMTLGMNLYIDKKGKRKESTGVEFPVKKENGADGGFANKVAQTPGAVPDPKAMREKMMASMILLKTFGFDDAGDKAQLITQPDGINIAFDWDEANVMYIEYQVPIRLLGKQAELNGKPIGFGWKINGTPQQATASSDALPVGGARGGGRSGGGSGAGGISSRSAGDAAPEARDNIQREQSFWSKYSLNF